MAASINDLKLTQAEYERFRDFILDRIGLDFPEDKRHMLSRGLTEVMGAIGCGSLDQLYLILQNRSSTNELWDQVVGALTVGETYFFRNSSHWDALRQHIVPDILTRRERASRHIRIWCAGCATGEEPYSVAILLREMIPNLENWNILILATDLNREALRKAQEGLYGPWSFRGVDKRIQDMYFTSSDKSYAIDDRIKRLVTFGHLNLVGDPYPSPINNTSAMDIILCRNVTIYFTSQVTQQVVRRFHEALTDGGWLIPGPSEPNMVYYGDFEARSFPGTVVYQKSRTPALPATTVLGSLQPTAPIPLPDIRVIKPRAFEPIAPKPIGFVSRGPTSPTPPDPFVAAQQLMQNGKLDEALGKLHEKLDVDASFVPAYYTLGKIYANQGNLEEAQTWCQKALDRDKLHAEPYYTMSLIYQQHGLLDQSIEMLKRAIYLDREFILAHYHLAQLYQQQNDPASARRSLQNVLRLLDNKARDELIPEGDGLMAGRLREMVENELKAQPD